MRKLCRVTLFFFAFCILTFSLSFALETITHEKINEFIAINTLNGFSLDSYLKNQLGFANGITEDIKSTETKKVFEWIKVGGLYEDNPPWTIPYFRSANHFHNPINKQGFSGIWGTGFVSGESSIPWSQKAIGTQSPGGYYSWYDARDYFYKALTATDKNTREKNFSDTFRGLGQLMHLVEDLSVPEHTRNDGHYLKAYEGWVKDTQKSNDPQRKAIFDTALANPIFFNKDALNQPSAFSTAPVPIANLFDTNTYNGSNPDVTINNNIGLSEYTNANFVSPDTRFKNFAYPSKDTSVVVVDYDIADPFNPGNTVKRPYYKKKADGDSGYLLTGVDYHRLYRQTNLSEPELGQLEVVVIAPMDGNVFSDYTKRLLPRAVGYSAGLLNYFFRGDIDLVDDATTGSGYVIVNNTEEDMNGTFELYYDNSNDERIKLQSWSLSIGKTSSGNNKSINITFTPPSDAKECGKYVLVFKGQMGNEQGAVVGKVVNTAENCSSLTIVDKDGTPATDTILRNGTLDFKTTDGCCGDIVWSVSVEAGSTLGGSTITQAGVLTAGATACGSLTVTATCLACGTSATQYVRVTNAGRWVWVEMCSGEDPQCGGEECIFISGQYRYSAYILYKYPPESCSWCLASCQTYGCTNNSPQIICGAQSSAKYQWQC